MTIDRNKNKNAKSVSVLKNRKFTKQLTKNLILHQWDGCTWCFKDDFLTLGSVLVRWRRKSLVTTMSNRFLFCVIRTFSVFRFHCKNMITTTLPTKTYPPSPLQSKTSSSPLSTPSLLTRGDISPVNNYQYKQIIEYYIFFFYRSYRYLNDVRTSSLTIYYIIIQKM